MKKVMEKKTGESYKSKAAMLKHEKTETRKERIKEYGTPKKKFAKGGMTKKGKAC